MRSLSIIDLYDFLCTYCLFQVRYQIIFFAYFVFRVRSLSIIVLYDLLYYLLCISGQISDYLFRLFRFLECVHFPIIDLYDLLYYLLSVSVRYQIIFSLISPSNKLIFSSYSCFIFITAFSNSKSYYKYCNIHLRHKSPLSI